MYFKIVIAVFLTLIIYSNSAAENNKIFFEIKKEKELRGHEGSVFGLSYFNDYTKLASCGKDGRVKVWNLTSAASDSLTLEIQQDTVWSVSVNQVNNNILRGCSDGTIKIWNYPEQSIITAFDGHEDSVWSVRYLNSGEAYLSSGRDGVLKLWDAKTNSIIRELYRSPVPIQALALSYDDKRCAAAFSDGIVRVFSLENGNCIAELDSYGEEDSIYSIDFSPNADFLAAGGRGGDIVVWETKKFGVYSRLETYKDAVNSVKFLGDWHYTVAGYSDGKIIIWDNMTKQKLAESDVDSYSVFFVAVDVKNNKFATAGKDGIIKIFSYNKIEKSEDKKIEESEKSSNKKSGNKKIKK